MVESSNVILSITLDEALSLCERREFERAMEYSEVFADLFDRLANRLSLVVHTIREHGSHFGTLPHVTPLASSNFRGSTAQRISTMSALLGKAVFSSRMRFFHKLNSLDEIITDLQRDTRSIVVKAAQGSPVFSERAWRELEVRGYDLNTCVGETTVVLKSFFCALPAEELEPFRGRLVALVPALLGIDPGPGNP